MKKSDHIFYLGLIIIGLVFAGTLIISAPQAGLTEHYDPEEDAYWPVISGDVMIYGIYDEMNYHRGAYYEKYYALMKNDILSIDDQGIDNDTFPDLLMNSQFLIGNEQIKVSIGQYFDFSLLGFLLGTIAGYSNPSGIVTIPSFPSFHIVSSDFITNLDLLTNSFFYQGYVPLYSFDYLPLNENFSDTNWQLNVTGPNTLIVKQMAKERNWSRGLEFNIQDNSRPCGITLKTYTEDAISSGGVSSFYYYPDPSLDLYYYQYDDLGEPINSNGIILKLNSTNVSMYQGNEMWFDNGVIQNWVANPEWGSWTPVAEVSPANWNKIDLEFPANYTKQINLSVNESPKMLLNYTVNQHGYSYKINKLDIYGTGISTGKEYFDDFDLILADDPNPLSSLQAYVFSLGVLKILNLFSIYSLFQMPLVFNWDAFYDLCIYFATQLDNRLRASINGWIPMADIFKSFFHNDADAFRVHFSGDTIDMILDTLEEHGIPRINISFVEGNADWYFDTCWDKDINALNQTIFHVNYTDIDATREIGIRLIMTRSPNKVQDGYWYYSGTWWDSTYIKVNRPYARHISHLNADRYPSKIPTEWNVFDPKKLTDAFLNEFEFMSVLEAIMGEIAPLLIVAYSGIIVGSTGLSFGVLKLLDLIRKRRK